MFDQLLLTRTHSAGTRCWLAQLASFLGHAGLAVLLFTSQVGSRFTTVPQSLRHVTLLFPLVEEAPVENSGRIAAPPRPLAPVPEPKLFSPPVAPPRQTLLSELAPAPAPEMKPAPVPVVPEARIPEPPLATSNLGDVVAVAPSAVPRQVQNGGFSQAEIASSSGPRGVPLKTGTFGVVGTAASQAPPGRYRFSAMVQPDGITTDQGPFFRIYDLESPARVNAVSEALLGSSDRRQVQVEFAVPPGSRILAVQIERKPSLRFDSKIAGALHVYGVSLVPVGGGAR